MKQAHFYMSLSKWGLVVLACVNKSQKQLTTALENFDCGYCRADRKRKYKKGKAYKDCTACNLYRRGVCGTEGTAYHSVTSKETSWAIKERKAKELMRAIMADVPKSILPSEIVCRGEGCRYDDV